MTIPKYSKPDVAMTADSVTAVVEIKATSSAAVREGLDLVAVVDVSGSMKGHKIESAKRALQFVIMKLTPADRLSIVTFNGAAEKRTPLRSMTQDAQNEIKAVADSLEAGGSTDIKAGLDLGLAILGGRVHTESRTPNIFLMSDGKLEGHTSGDPRDVHPGEVPVYTFGFGRGTEHEVSTLTSTNIAKILYCFNTSRYSIYDGCLLIYVCMYSCSPTSPRIPLAGRTALCETGRT
jgi:uncharacterized protein YegL